MVCYAASSSDLLLKFRDNLLVPPAGNLRMGAIGCPETSVGNYHYSLRNNPEKRSYYWSLSYKTVIRVVIWFDEFKAEFRVTDICLNGLKPWCLSLWLETPNVCLYVLNPLMYVSMSSTPNVCLYGWKPLMYVSMSWTL